MSMDIKGFATKKIGPVPVWVIGIGVVGVGGYLWYRKRTTGSVMGGAGAAGNGTSLSSPDQGTFTGDYSVTGGDGSTATMTSQGPLLTGAWVGNPVGYPNASIPGGDTYINIPGSPAQTTTSSTQAQTYTVQSGDTLRKIAFKLFGNPDNWRDIFRANASLIGSDPNSIQAGQVLTIPTLTPGTDTSSSMPDHNDHKSRNRRDRDSNDRYSHSGRGNNRRGW